jgi:parvulin-like peptidyl-prolyl isomerase
MMPSGRIDGQNQAYRRGLVMGLTMAEVGILIIFVLLLLIAWSALKQQREARARVGQPTVSSTQLAALQRSDQSMKELAKAVGLGPESPPSEIALLVKSVKQAAATEAGASALAQSQATLDDIRETRDRLRQVLQDAETSGAEAVLNTVEQQSFELGVKDGQLKYAQNRLAALGSGSGERPCWVEPDGTVRFLYDVLLTSQGIQLRERQGLQEVRGRFPLPVVQPSVVLSEEAFLTLTRTLYNYGRSDERQCRFHVWIFDGTEPEEKVLYKKLINTVEGHFYRQYRVSDGISF